MAPTGQRWMWVRGDRLAIGALVAAIALWIPATFASACAACGSFDGIAAVARGTVAFAPFWLMLLTALARRLRPALVLLLIASAGMAILTAFLGTTLRSALEPVGLGSAPGFVAYSIPFAITAVAAALGLWAPAGSR
jgi:glucan phosphoethanolaminetransferase (alkaline phosphatase superfamily)